MSYGRVREFVSFFLYYLPIYPSIANEVQKVSVEFEISDLSLPPDVRSSEFPFAKLCLVIRAVCA